jgi:hypothetical protein
VDSDLNVEVSALKFDTDGLTLGEVGLGLGLVLRVSIRVGVRVWVSVRVRVRVRVRTDGLTLGD